MDSRRIQHTLANTASVLLLAMLGACASLPDAERLSAQRERVRVATQSGEMSKARSATMIAALDTKEDGFLARHLAVEQAISGAPLVAGNATQILKDGPSTYKAMLAEIRRARYFIHMESYIFDDDAVGNFFADELIAKRRQGVDVALMVDAVGTLTSSDALFARLRDEGIAVVVFNPLNPMKGLTSWSPNQRSHRKLLVVDGKVGFVGGINVSDVYQSSSFVRSSPDPEDLPGGKNAPWRDTHVRIEGPAVAEIERVFQDGWQSQNGAPISTRQWLSAAGDPGNTIVRILANCPGAEDSFSVYLTLMSAFQSAQRSIYITMAYFVPDPAFIEALSDAARRGVDVVLVLPGFSDSSIVLQAGRSNYQALLDAGVKIYERRDALLHAKTAVVDGVWSTIGSSNMDWRSFTLNYEINAVMLGDTFATEMEGLFAMDRAAAVRITPQMWRDRGMGDRFTEFFGRLFERML